MFTCLKKPLKSSSRKNRVEKSLRHVSMVAKILDLNKRSMAAMSISALASFFADEPKSINRGENHYNSKHVESFEYADGVMRGNVHASMKNRTYKTTVSVKKVLIDSRHHDTVVIML